MASTTDIRNKIASIKNMQKITKAMEMVAASKMRKTQERMMSSRPYIETMNKVISHLILGNLEYKHSYLHERNVKCIGYLVVSTDRGLAGSLNINLFKKLIDDIKLWTERGVDIKLALIGFKALSFFSSLSSKIMAKLIGIGDNPKLSELSELIKVMLQAYDEEHIDRIYIVNNKFVNSISQIPQILQILPFPLVKTGDLKSKYWDYLYEPDSKTLLNILLRRFIESQVYHSVIENLASEQAARMIAMKAATDNGSNLIKDLELIYNKVRQNNITNELTEIISGAAVV